MLKKSTIEESLDLLTKALNAHADTLAIQNETLLSHGNSLLRLHATLSDSISTLLERVTSSEKLLSTAVIAAQEQIKVMREELDLVKEVLIADGKLIRTSSLETDGEKN